MAKSILIKQTKSKTQSNPSQKATLKSLGLRGVGSMIYRKDTRAIRGMLNHVQTWITAQQVEPSPKSRPAKLKKNPGYVLG